MSLGTGMILAWGAAWFGLRVLDAIVPPYTHNPAFNASLAVLAALVVLARRIDRP